MQSLPFTGREGKGPHAVILNPGGTLKSFGELEKVLMLVSFPQ